MGRKIKHYQELRIRQRVGENGWMKKSKFYLIDEPGRVVTKVLKRQTNPTTVISLQKVPKEKILGEFPQSVAADIMRSQVEPVPKKNGLREFLGLGDKLLSELKDDKKEGIFDALGEINIGSKRKRMLRRGYYDRERKRTASG